MATKNKALVVDGVATNVCLATEVGDRFHPDIAAQFVDVPIAVQEGWLQAADGSWAAPLAPPAPTQPEPPPEAYVDDVPTFMLRFTPQARIAIRASDNPIVQDFYALLQDPRTQRVNRALDSVKAAIAYMAGELDLGAGLMAPSIIDPADLAALLAPESPT